MDIQQDFQDGCNEIMAALAAKGVTPTSNSPADIVASIDDISTASSAHVFTSSPVNMSNYTDKWKDLTVADFVVGGTNISLSMANQSIRQNPESVSTSSNCTLFYNASTGILTFGGCSASAATNECGGSVSLSGTFAVWLGTVGGK